MGERIEGLRHIVVPEFVFGEGARHLAPSFLRNFDARRVLVVTDPGVVAAGWTDEVVNGIVDAGIPAVRFSEVSTNPRSYEVAAGAGVYDAEGCDAIVAVGGGSVIDCAKGIGIVASHGSDILEYCGVDTVELPTPPLVCVSTTTTSADVSQFAIITDLDRRDKRGIISKMIVPDVSLLDPIVYTSLSPRLSSMSGIDSLGQAIEAYVSNAHSPFTDLLALDAVRLVWNTLPLVYDQPRDVALRSDLMFGNLEGGIAFSNASLGLAHATAHAVGGMTDAHHGACVAAMLPAVVEFNYSAAPRRFDALAASVGLPLDSTPPDERGAAFARMIIDLQQRIGARVTLSDLGLDRTDTAELVAKAIADPTLVTNPRQATATDIGAVYDRAF